MSSRFEGPRRNRELLRRCRAIYRRRTPPPPMPPPASAAWMAARGEAAMRLVSATATLYNTPSLSLSRSPDRAPRQLVSKKEAACLASFLPSRQGCSLSLSSSRTGLHSSQRRSVGEERLYDTQESPAPPPRGRTDGPEERESGRGGFATKQTRKQAKARYRRCRAAGSAGWLRALRLLNGERRGQTPSKATCIVRDGPKGRKGSGGRRKKRC